MNPRAVSAWTAAAVLSTYVAGVCAQPAGVDPEAATLLRTSMSFLASQKRFTVDTHNSIEAVLTSGQKLQFLTSATAAVERPNRMRADRRGELVDQRFIYDGKSLTLYNPGQRYFATVPAPGTLDAMLDFARNDLDVIAPGSDLLYSNAYEILMDGVTSGMVVGTSVVEGVRCRHLAFRGAEVDWQIWIREGKQPLPCRWIITTKDVAGSPQFTVTMTRWNLAPTFDAGTFSFTPAGNARGIEFLQPVSATVTKR